MSRAFSPSRRLVAALVTLLCACSAAPIDAPPEGTAPSNTTIPAVSGNVQEGQTLTSTDGSWSGTTPITYTYQWKRCNSSGASCTDISTATAKTHLLGSADVGFTIRSTVTATNAAGTASMQSAATSVVSPVAPPNTPPSNTAAPTVSGTAQEGQTLTSSDGSWSGTAPITYTYQWKRCNASGAACTDIAGATSKTRALATADVGSTLRSTVTATNTAGTATVQSAATGVVAALVPNNTSCPQIASPPPGYCTGQVYAVTPTSMSLPTLNPGDVVVFENGTYTDVDGDGTVVMINQGGTATQYVTFVSRNKRGAKLDGQNNTSRYGINFGAVSYVRVEGFEIYGFGSSYAGTVAVPSASGIMLQNGGTSSQLVGNHIHNISNFCNSTIRAQTGIFIQKQGVVIEGNVIHDVGRYDPGENGCTYAAGFNKYKNSDTGIYLQSPGHSNITIRNNIFYNHKNGWAIYVYQGGPSNIKILNNTFAFGNPYWSYTHIFTDADLVDFQLRNNVFYEPNGGYVMAWDLEPLVNVVITNNIASGQFLLSGADGSPVTTLPAGMTESNNRFATDPLLVAPSSFDFRLQAGSPAIDGGLTISDVTDDINRAARPQGVRHDVGAYEGTSGPSVSSAIASRLTVKEKRAP